MLIFLIGYMGCGKSTIGKLLAEQLEIPLVDSDTYIEHIESMKISEIFVKKGEVYFRNLESAFLYALKPDRMVVSTGGGMPCYNDNMKMMNETGKTIYLKVPSNILAERLLDSEDRPLLKDLDEIDLKTLIEHQLKERSIIYNQSQLVVDASWRPEEIIKHIIENL